jgi:predicted  nucleic acid-binding Zn-ribbon protein|tara:strand:- start:1413 stop:2000 length:588 start_codon:yes stop_codon:yes gene_type:complete
MEVEYGGIKASGGKLFIIISLLGTIGGGLWGGFELFKRYEDMEAKISSYVAPDLSGFDKRIEVMETLIKEQRTTINVELNTLKELVSDAQETARDIRTDIKGDVNEVLDQISAIDKRSRVDALEVRQTMRGAESEIRQLITSTNKDIRELITSTEKRWDDKLTKVDSQIETLEKKIDRKITKALENPLAAMSKTK